MAAVIRVSHFELSGVAKHRASARARSSPPDRLFPELHARPSQTTYAGAPRHGTSNKAQIFPQPAERRRSRCGPGCRPSDRTRRGRACGQTRSCGRVEYPRDLETAHPWETQPRQRGLPLCAAKAGLGIDDVTIREAVEAFTGVPGATRARARTCGSLVLQRRDSSTGIRGDALPRSTRSEGGESASFLSRGPRGKCGDTKGLEYTELARSADRSERRPRPRSLFERKAATGQTDRRTLGNRMPKIVTATSMAERVRPGEGRFATAGSDIVLLSPEAASFRDLYQRVRPRRAVRPPRYIYMWAGGLICG